MKSELALLQATVFAYEQVVEALLFFAPLRKYVELLKDILKLLEQLLVGIVHQLQLVEQLLVDLLFILDFLLQTLYVISTLY